MFTLAHLSDPHLGLTETPRWRELVSKRITGYVNLTRVRAGSHSDLALDTIVSDIASSAPDHVAVTGDLINIALAHEYGRARAWLEQLGPPDHVSLVPGNHDAYLRRPARRGMGYWVRYMQGDGLLADAPPTAQSWPYIRRRGPLALIGLSSAIATGLLMATGRVGRAQRDRLAPILRQLREEGLFRVILIHHPPVPGASSRHKRLIDARAVARVICAEGAELVLHGHNHTDTLQFLPGAAGPIPVVGVPSASSLGRGHHPPAQHHLFHISGKPGRWQCELVARSLLPATGTIHTAYTQQLNGATARIGPP